jgi:3-carboxy-cis,cis-muconate cycloisomerase
LRRDTLVLQFGGGAGTLAALGDRGFSVAERLAALLDLQLPDAPWHSHRDRLAEIAAAFAILAGTCGKIARDVALMMQSEVGEASEPQAPGRGVSSTLPHKRNPSGAAAALSAATVAPNLAATILAAQVQEHERGVGGWQSEWVSFPALALVASGALDAVADIAEGLEIDLDHLRANLELGGGRIMTEAVSFALAEKVGRVEAQRLVQELCQRADKEKRSLKDVLSADLRVRGHLSSVEIEKLLIPLTYQGSAQLFIERLVVASQSRAARRLETRAAEPKLPTAPQLPPIPAAEIAAPAVEPPTPGFEPAPASVSPEAAHSVEPAAAVPAASAEDTPPAEPLAASASEEAPPAPPSPAPARKAVPAPQQRPADEDAPGALMDVLSRAEAEARAAEFADGKPKSS